MTFQLFHEGSNLKTWDRDLTKFYYPFSMLHDQGRTRQGDGGEVDVRCRAQRVGCGV